MANKNIVKGNIGNALHDVSPNHTVATADEIFDESMQMYQNEINAYGGAYDISRAKAVDGNLAIFVSLSDALGTNGANVPVKTGGMSVKFILNNSNYAVTKQEGLTTAPEGTLITSNPNVNSGTYKAAQLVTYFATLPTSTGAGNALVYYKAISGDTTTYTSWTITLSNSDNEYVQFQYLLKYENTTDGNAAFIKPVNWKGTDEKLIAGSKSVPSGNAVEREFIKVLVYNVNYFENGSISSTDGSETTTSNRCRTKYINIDSPMSISCNLPFKVTHYPTNSVPSDFTESSFSNTTRVIDYSSGYIRIAVDISNSSIDSVNMKMWYEETLEKQIQQIKDFDITPTFNSSKLFASSSGTRMLIDKSMIINNILTDATEYQEKSLPQITNNKVEETYASNIDTLKFNASYLTSIKVADAPYNAGLPYYGITLIDANNDVLSHYNDSADLNSTDLENAVYVYVTLRRKTASNYKGVKIIINGIPFTFAALGDALGTIKETKLDKDRVPKIYLDGLLESGAITGINTGNWSYSNNSKRVRTCEGVTLTLSKGDVIKLSDYDSYYMYVGWKYGNNYGSTNGWKQIDIVAPVDGDYVICLMNSDNTEITVNELLSVVSISSFTFKNPKTFRGQYTTDTTFVVKRDYTNKDVISQLTIKSKYTGSATPKISISAQRKDGTMINILKVPFSNEDYVVTNIFSLPPLFGDCVLYKIKCIVPSGTELDIEDSSVIPDTILDSGIKMDAHLGFYAFETSNSILAFEYAGRSGFARCICNPIQDEDGEIWCYHTGNETVIVNGQTVSIDIKHLPTSVIETYTQDGKMSEGYPLPKFEDFCRICAKYGMRASLSIGYLGDIYYQKAKEILQKYNLLDGVIIKDGLGTGDTVETVISRMTTMYSVFGDKAIYELYFIPCTTAAIDALYAANFGTAKRIAEPKKADFEALTDDSIRKTWCDYAASKEIGLAMIQNNNEEFDFERYVKFGFTEFTSDTLAKMWY